MTTEAERLVEQLREMVLDMTTDREPVTASWPKICTEAADEIERLRGMLLEISNKLHYGEIYQWDGGQEVWKQLRSETGVPE